ncbi:MAG: hypothetical protein ACE15B_08060 [Bryobacteraceae bacterium]
MVETEVIEESPPETREVPEVVVEGEEAVVRLDTPEGLEERRVKLPKTTWG